MRKRFLICITAAIVLIASTLLIVGLGARDRAIEDADRTLVARAQTTADALDRTLQQRMIQTFTFATLPSLRALAASDPTERPARMALANAELRAMVAADSNIRVATIVDAFGTVILTTDNSMNADWSHRTFVRQALLGQIYASVPSRDFGEISQFYSAPLLNNSGDVAGAVVIRVAAQELWGVLNGQTDTLLIDENDMRIADRAATPQLFVSLAPLGAGVINQFLAEQFYGAEITQIRSTNLTDLAYAVNRQTTQVSYTSSQGQIFHAATARLKTNSWTVVAQSSEDSILAPAWESIFDQIKVAVATALIAAGTAIIALSPHRSSETSQ